MATVNIYLRIGSIPISMHIWCLSPAVCLSCFMALFCSLFAFIFPVVCFQLIDCITFEISSALSGEEKIAKQKKHIHLRLPLCWVKKRRENCLDSHVCAACLVIVLFCFCSMPCGICVAWLNFCKTTRSLSLPAKQWLWLNNRYRSHFHHRKLYASLLQEVALQLQFKWCFKVRKDQV